MSQPTTEPPTPTPASPPGATATATAAKAGDRPTGAGFSGRIQAMWRRLAPLPGGKWLFSKAIGWTAPYTGTIGARVEELEPGYARVSLRDRRKVRNHLRSVHAIALINLAEECSGLAGLFSLPPELRGIPTHLEIDYLKKARGRITAHCRIELPGAPPEGRFELELPVELVNETGETVARALARWVIGR